MSTPTGPRVRTRLWRRGRLVREDFPLDELDRHLADTDALVWVDLCDPDHEHLMHLAAELAFDSHAVEDAITHGERPKATRHATHTFLTVYATALTDDANALLSARASLLQVSRISAFVLPRGIVTVRLTDAFDLTPVLERWDADSDLLQYGVGALVHGLLDVVVDGHFDTIQGLDDAIEGLEDILFDERDRVREVQEHTYRIRKELVELRRIVLPMREVVNGVLRHRQDRFASEGSTDDEPTNGPTPAGNELDGFYEDLYDHVLRAAEWTESLRDMVTTIFETNLSLQDARLNTVMKKLTGWAAIIAVPTAITGWFGQNLPFPGFAAHSGLIWSAGTIAVLSTVLYVVFRRRNWI